MNRICLAVWCGVLLGGCASQPPRWAGKMWQTQNRLYFTGTSSSCQTVSCAYENAYQQALGAIVQYLNSQISVHAIGRLDNQGSELEVKTEIITRQIELEKVKVEEFNCLERGKKQVCFMLVSIGNKELRVAEQKLKDQQEKMARRKQMIFQVKGEESLVPVLQSRLRANGFQTGKNGKIIQIYRIKTICAESQLQSVWVNTTLISVQFEHKKVDFSAKGYGLSCDQAYDETIEEVVRQIVNWIEENI